MQREVTIPVRLVSEANVVEHWAKRAKRAKEHRFLACHYLQALPRWVDFALACHVRGATVTITRHGVKLLDDDNLARSAKHVRDGVADALALDDGDKRIRWQYFQRVTGDYSATITLETEGSCLP